MQFISKFKYRKKGHRIFKAFIKNKWDNDSQKYINLNYNELKRYKVFKYLLLKEQQGFCCYCMREIPFNEVTLEHVMPHHLDDKKRQEEIMYYSKFGRLKRGKITYCPDEELSTKLHTPPYPHCIAYENLVVSCQGKVFEGGEKYVLHKCCNNFRGNNKIIPLFFIPRVVEIVRYEIDGTLTYFEKYDSTIKSLNLMHSTLIFMRKTWAKIVINKISLNQVNKALTDIEIRANIIDDIDINLSERKNLRIDLYWKLLIEYHWFYKYFQRMMASLDCNLLD
ncbi:MAG: hypothetical protein EOM50_18145 [Erysipelotrichia bacterium]|nr:hypothetical protein [Erysipelotrichia bacterium]